MREKHKKSSFKKGIICFSFFLVLSVFLILGYCIFYNDPKILPDTTYEEEKPKVQIIDEDSTSRSYGVMINNIGVARNLHSGLQDAYLVYEMIVEGGITRLFAMYSNTNTERIGPIRSARPYYLDYAMENDAYFVHWGFSDQAKNDISKYGIQNINGLYQDRYFWKDNSLNVASEHRAFTSMEKLEKAVKDMNYRDYRKKDFLFSYSVSEIEFLEDQVQVANEVLIPYSSGTQTKYVYDENSKTYLRYVNDKVHQDYVTKEQYRVKNIITYQIPNQTIDSYGRQSLDNIKSGTGYYITNGVAVKIRFSKKSRDSKTVYTYMDGSELVLNDGNTWIQIQPMNQKLSIS